MPLRLPDGFATLPEDELIFYARDAIRGTTAALKYLGRNLRSRFRESKAFSGCLHGRYAGRGSGALYKLSERDQVALWLQTDEGRDFGLGAGTG